jgi:molybdopterin synthase catalytic subunit
MQKELILTGDRIAAGHLAANRKMGPGMGAAVCFSGVVRSTEAGREIAAIDYECFEKMARHQFDLLFQTVAARWPIESVRVVHRLGRVEAGETAIWMEVIAPHRQEAFAACQFIIDEMKRVVPIWKKPLATDMT